MSHQSDLISTDINAYLAQHERKELLRLLTCGSVDDGKSTLIGRLLHDSKMIYEDQLSAIKADSVKSGTTGGGLDLALLVDGLQAEREQGITIDVAYRYFSTARRKFIIADTPGHEQYTRNMATGASTCDLAVILVRRLCVQENDGVTAVPEHVEGVGRQIERRGDEDDVGPEPVGHPLHSVDGQADGVLCRHPLMGVLGALVPFEAGVERPVQHLAPARL